MIVIPSRWLANFIVILATSFLISPSRGDEIDDAVKKLNTLDNPRHGEIASKLDEIVVRQTNATIAQKWQDILESWNAHDISLIPLDSYDKSVLSDYEQQLFFEYNREYECRRYPVALELDESLSATHKLLMEKRKFKDAAEHEKKLEIFRAGYCSPSIAAMFTKDAVFSGRELELSRDDTAVITEKRLRGLTTIKVLNVTDMKCKIEVTVDAEFENIASKQTKSVYDCTFSFDSRDLQPESNGSRLYMPGSIRRDSKSPGKPSVLLMLSLEMMGDLGLQLGYRSPYVSYYTLQLQKR